MLRPTNMVSGGIRVSQTDWLRKLTQLNKARDNAPHKPLMLLVFLDIVENGALVGSRLPLTPELAYRFVTYFEVARHRRSARPDVRMPFHHLSTDGFWSPRTDTGVVSKHRATTAYVEPDPEFVEVCRDPEFRRQARCVLIENHFEAAERNALYHLIGMEIPPADEIARNACFETPNDAENEGRSARFRLDIVSAYNYTCALTGYRVTTIAAGAIVDAAHIHQFSDSRNNDPNNGIALCKNAHWQFDAGLWTIDDEYRVVVAREAFSEASPNQKPLSDMHGQPLLLPRDELIWPSRVNLAWHRAKKFRRFG
jgi:putative restriction endonuclease